MAPPARIADAKAAGAPPRTMAVRVPLGSPPGSEIRFHTPEGAEMKMQVPAVLPPNRQIVVAIPPAPAAAPGGRYVRFQSVGDRSHFLRASVDGEVDGKSDPSADAAIFRLEPQPSDGKLLIVHAKSGRYIFASRDGQTVTTTPRRMEATRFVMQELKGVDFAKLRKIQGKSNPLSSLPLSNQFKDAKLTREQLIAFRDDGFIVVRGAIPQGVVQNALRVINRAIADGKHGPNATFSDGLKSDGTGRFPQEVRSHPDVVALFRLSRAFGYVDDLLGRGAYHIPNGCQVALRYPLPKNRQRPAVLPRSRWHIDGMDKNRANGFSLLMGVCISPWSAPFCGNFTVFPGTHYEIANALKSMGEDNFFAAYANPRPEVAAPARQIVAQPGDIVLAHSLLPHRAGPNFSCNIRYACFFRLTRKNRVPDRTRRRVYKEALFLEFPAVRALGPGQPRRQTDAKAGKVL